MDISMDIHEKSVDMDMDMDVIFHIHGNPGHGTRSLRSKTKIQLRHAFEILNEKLFFSMSPLVVLTFFLLPALIAERCLQVCRQTHA